MWPFTRCAYDSCEAENPAPITTSVILASLPFLLVFASVTVLVVRHIFPRLNRAAEARDGEDHVLPSHAPPALRAAHAEHGVKSWQRRGVAWTFGVTCGLAATLGTLVMDEIMEVVNHTSRRLALRITVPSLLFMLVVLVPWLECRSVVVSAGWSFQRTAKGTLPRTAWAMHLLLYLGWLFAFWSVGRAVPTHAMTAVKKPQKDIGLSEIITRGCLERIGVVGIALMALLSGFAAVSSPWQTLVAAATRRKRPVTEGDVNRKQAGLEAANEMLTTKRHRLQYLERRIAERQTAPPVQGTGLVGKFMGSLRGSSGEELEIKTLRTEIAGLEAMEANLASGLSILKNHRDMTVRAASPLGRFFLIPSYLFSFYCIYRIVATTMTTLHRASSPSTSFASSDPINRFLSIFARHWDPKLDQLAWARFISFALSGVILLASANSVVQTFHLFAKWTPGLLHQAQANMALVVGQIAATYVISSSLLLRSQLPTALGSAVGSVLRGALSPSFVDGWFEGWFLFGSLLTAVGIWVGRKLSGDEDWDDYGMEEMGAKRS
ncbi:Abscisic acid G-protein coupled receptor-domain-containing protein [Mariannaea sp. PMI_226]|nr:Abscisic acid G-protein coupled receptor-domain-containing protein [Mariannaea sp. PMI_226]